MTVLNSIANFVAEMVVYLRCDPPIDDFMKYNGSFVISSLNRTITVKVASVPIKGLYAVLQRGVFFANHTVLTWDVKKINSYFKHALGKVLKPAGTKAIDLKYGLAYLGKRIEKAPDSAAAALEAARILVNDKNWRHAHASLHHPLAWDVLPEVENRMVVDSQKSTGLYSCYEIEGQTNGRLLCRKASDKYLSVHSLSPPQKAALLPKDYFSDDWYFLLLDYRHMEASVLAWLSEDEVLADALSNTGEFYDSLVTFNCDLVNVEVLEK